MRIILGSALFWSMFWTVMFSMGVIPEGSLAKGQFGFLAMLAVLGVLYSVYVVLYAWHRYRPGWQTHSGLRILFILFEVLVFLMLLLFGVFAPSFFWI